MAAPVPKIMDPFCILKWKLLVQAILIVCFINSRKFHKDHKSLPAVNLSDRKIQTQTQKVISAYNKLREEGEVPEENLYREAADLMNAAAESNSVPSSFQEAGMDTGVNIKDIFKD
jgi:hypothetical protein